jgi:hypothetical protein
LDVKKNAPVKTQTVGLSANFNAKTTDARPEKDVAINAPARPQRNN